MEVQVMIQTEPGKCAKCGSKNIEYKDYELDIDFLNVEYVCNDCEHDGCETWNVMYAGSI